ncbi:MAG: hypothetical protein KGL35_20400, partial [Bradyrhizobium sp.]|nr:hypothetical protein [Bradyrhizobium sp.]
MSDRRLSSFDQTLKKLLDNAAKDNLADDIEEEERGLIGRRVRRGFEIDDESRTEWKDKAHKAMEAALQVRKSKSFPFDRASNVKYPLLTTAA